MRTYEKKKSLLWAVALLFLLALGMSMAGRSTEVQAAARYYNKLVWNSAHTERYYYNSSGNKVKNSWVTVGRYKYYADSEGCLVLDDWIKSGKNYYYVNRNGAMYTSRHLEIEGIQYYFDKSGAMHRGWLSEDGEAYYYNNSGAMLTSWQKIGGGKYYFFPKDGTAAIGWVKSGLGNYYYFEESDTSRFQKYQMHTSWLDYNGRRYYMRPSTGRMVKNGTYSIGGKKYTFDKYGVLNGDNSVKNPGSAGSSGSAQKPGSARTLKNLMLNALQPVGQCLYMWGGGHNTSDATRKGVSATWKKFYDQQPASYDYHTYKDQGYEAYGLDCSGYVGWALYNVMNSSSGKSSLTYWSGDYVGNLVAKGWGTRRSVAQIAAEGYKARCGDIGGDADHVWMVLGQCKDGSAVILHSTPDAGPQIAGTPVPDTFDYDSQAAALAKKYMSKYAGYKKYDYHTSTNNFLRRAAHFRWNLSKGPLSDPDGYRNMTADQTLKDLFGY